jgi:cell wall-associated NlpC family hydrolase
LFLQKEQQEAGKRTCHRLKPLVQSFRLSFHEGGYYSMQSKQMLRGLVGLSILVLAGCGHSSGSTANHTGNATSANATHSIGAKGGTSNAQSSTSVSSATTTNYSKDTVSSTSSGTSSGDTNSSAVTTSSDGVAPQLQTIMGSTVQTLLAHPQAKTPVDCSALVQYVYAQAGIKVPRTVSQQATVGTPIPQSQLAYGDIVFFDLSSTPGTPTFDGIYVGNGQLVARTGHGIESIQIDSVYWKDKFMYGEHVV